MRTKFLGSNWLFCFISICKFGSFKNPFATITSLSKLTLEAEDLSFWSKMKKMISMNYGNSTSSWKPWRCVRLDLVFSMGDIYINFNLKPLTKFTSSSRRAKLKDFLPWNISQMITRTIPISTSIVISSAMKRSILLWIWWMGSQWKLI